MKKSKLVLLLLVAALAIGFFALDLGRFLNLAYLRESQAGFAQLYAQSPWLVRGTYFMVYVAVATLSLPGAALLTLGGGGIFGLGWGLLLVSFASTVGAIEWTEKHMVCNLLLNSPCPYHSCWLL